MSQKRSVRACVAGLVFACAVAGTPSMMTSVLADTVVTTIPVESKPTDFVINPEGTFGYVLAGSSLIKINLSTDTVAKTINLGSGIPTDFVINPEGTFGYVLTGAASSLKKINLSTDTVVAQINLDVYLPTIVVINPAGTFAYVIEGSSLIKINLSTDTVVTSISIKTDEIGAVKGGVGYPRDVAINSAGIFAYVTAGSFLVKINLSTDTVVTSIPLSIYAFRLAINPAGTFAYVNLNTSLKVAKINLSTDTVVTTTTVNDYPTDVAINPAGTFAYVTNGTSRTVSKIAITATDSQSISFVGIGKSVVPVPLTQLLGTKTALISATATSGLPVTFSSATPTVCTVSGATVTLVKIGDCTINANQAGGSGWDAAPQIVRTFAILPSPPAGEIGVSIKNGDAFTNTKNIALNLVWPENATAARISNDGGFAKSKTKIVVLGASVDWTLDDSVKGVYTKVVYVRFNGVADTSKTYTDDIIFDTTAPVVESASAAAVLESINVSLKATDDITGMDKVEISNGTSTFTENYDTKLTVTEKGLGLTVSSFGIQKLASSSIKIRVSDKAGNWSAYKALAVSGAVTAPKVTFAQSFTAKSIAKEAKLAVPSTSKVSLEVVSNYSKYCKVSGTTLKGVKAGTCKVTVTVTPKKGRATSKTVTLRVTK